MKQTGWLGDGVHGLHPKAPPRPLPMKRRGRAKTQADPRFGEVITCKIALPESEISWRALDRADGSAPCQHLVRVGSGSRSIDVRDVARYKRPTWLRVERIRQQCKDCGAVLIQAVPSVDETLNVTKRLRRDIFYTAIKHSFDQTAHMMGVDAGKVRKVFAQCVSEVLPDRMERLPRIISVDETKLGGEFRFICCDPVSGTVVDILKDMKDETIEAFFRGFPNRDEVEMFISDMRPNYLRIGHQLFPKVAVVIDRYHVVAEINKAMSKARRRVVASLGPEKGYVIRGFDHLLTRRWDTLEKQQQADLERIWQIEHTGDLLEHASLRRAEKVGGGYLKRAYRFKDELQELYEFSDAEKGLAAFKAHSKTCRKDPQLTHDFGDVIRLMSRHEDLIFNFYLDKRTNGFAEGMNGCLKQIEAAQRGLKFEDIRAKARLRYGDFVDREALRAY